MPLPAATSADFRTIFCGTSWASNQLRGHRRAGSDGRVQIRRENGGSKLPGERFELQAYQINESFTEREKSVGEREGDEGAVKKSQTNRSQLKQLRIGLVFTSGLKRMPSNSINQERLSRIKTHGQVIFRGLSEFH